MLGREPRSLDRQPYLVSNDVQQLQFFWLQFTPVFTGDIEHAEGRGTCVDGYAGMETQPPRGWVAVALGILEAAAAQDIDVGPPFKTAFQKGIQAHTVAGHTLWMVGKVRGK